MWIPDVQDLILSLNLLPVFILITVELSHFPGNLGILFSLSVVLKLQVAGSYMLSSADFKFILKLQTAVITLNIVMMCEYF